MSLLDARTRQYENNTPSPAALAFFSEFVETRHSTPATSPPSAPLGPPAEVVTDVIVTLLDGRLDARAILRAVSARLDFNLPSDIPGPDVLLPDAPIVPTFASRNDLAVSIAQWREHARLCHRLRKLAASFCASRLSSSPPVVSTSTWAERDAALRAEAVSLPSSTSTPSEGQPEGLPFATPEELPADLVSSKDHAVICRILSSRPDHTQSRWRRRIFFTPENWNEWATWSPPTSNHRDRNESGRVFLDPASILTALDLRSADAETAADAWNVYRRRLITFIREALTVGFPWCQILARLSTTLSDPTRGYPRLVNYINAALEATELLKYPLLHADVLLYNIDYSYAMSSSKYAGDSLTIDWESAVSRLPGEDPVSLAIRVINACLTMHDDAALTNVTVWSKPSLVNEINRRYAECLARDESDPDRGAESSVVFRRAWNEAQALLDDSDFSERNPFNLSCERLAGRVLVPYEIAHYQSTPTADSAEAYAAAPPLSAQPPPQLTYNHHTTGRGARARRDAARAHLQTNYHEEPPPQYAYSPDTLPRPRRSSKSPRRRPSS
jgi:hypothetical protein